MTQVHPNAAAAAPQSATFPGDAALTFVIGACNRCPPASPDPCPTVS